MGIELTDSTTIEEVLEAVRDLLFKGGNVKMGDALTFVARTVFRPAASRDDAAKVRTAEWLPWSSVWRQPRTSISKYRSLWCLS